MTAQHRKAYADCWCAGVILLGCLANKLRLVPITRVDGFIMAYGGLRGAIAFSLVVLLDDKLFGQKRLFLTTTVVVIYFTVFIQVWHYLPAAAVIDTCLIL